MILHFEKAIQLKPRAAEFHYKLANALSQVGRTVEAIKEYNVALEIQPDYVQACNNLAWILASNSDASLRNGPRAVTLAERAEQLSRGENPVVLGTLAVAYANVGNFTRAIVTAQRALGASLVNSNSLFAAALRGQISLYQAGTPFRETPPTPQSSASSIKH